MCIEVLDGIRICFNTYLLKELLISENEEAQYFEMLNMSIQPPVNNMPQYDHVIFLISISMYLKICFFKEWRRRI